MEILHENWSDYPEKEIKAIKTEKCTGCVYLKHFQTSYDTITADRMYCGFSEVTGKPRLTRLEVCDKKSETKQLA